MHRLSPWSWIILSGVTLALITASEAIAQTPGRYLQRNIVQKVAGIWEFRVEAVDVLPEKGFRVHLAG